MIARSALTCKLFIAGLVHFANKKLESDDSVDDDDEYDQERDVQQGHHSLDDRVEDHLQAWCVVVEKIVLVSSFQSP